MLPLVLDGTFEITGAISGVGGLTKIGSGALRLSGANTYSGLTRVSEGFILAHHASAFGSSAVGTELPSASGFPPCGIRVEGVTVANESLTNNSINSALEGQTGVASGWSGNIVLKRDHDVLVSTNGTLNLSGQISGTGGIIKSELGTLQYSGSSANSYTGNTTVNQGVLELAKVGGAATMISGQLIIGDGIGGVNADVVRYADNNQISSTVDIIVNDTGLLDLNNFSDTVGAIALIGGEIDTGTGTLAINANLTATSTALTDADIVGNLNLGSSTRTFTVTNGATTFGLQVAASVRGTGGIIKAGDGLMDLTRSNSFSGAVTVNDGTLRLDDDFASGTTAGGVTVNGDAILQIVSGADVGTEPLTLNSTAATGALEAINGSNSWAGTVTLAINSIVNVDTSDTLNLLGQITGPGGLTKIETGTLIYSGSSANNYAGVTTVNQGTLVLGKSVINGALTNALSIGDGLGGANADVVRTEGIAQLPDTVGVTVNSSGRWEVNAAENSFGSLAGSGNVAVNTAPPSGIGPGFNHSSTAFNGIISGTGAFTKNGTGTMTLSSNNSYTGTTTVSTGTLLVNGSQPQSHVSVSGAGTLGGSGTVGNITNVLGGVVAPGSSPGTLTSSNITFSGTSSDFTVELNGSTPGTGYDQLNVRGGLTLNNATLRSTLGFPSAISNSFTIIDNDDTEAVTNTFNGLPEGATVNVSGTPFRITYAGGSGNDVVLTQLTATQQPLLNIQRSSETNVVLSWATNFTGYTLEANTNLNTNVWATVSSAPSVIGTNNVVTDSTSGQEKYFRLRAP